MELEQAGQKIQIGQQGYCRVATYMISVNMYIFFVLIVISSGAGAVGGATSHPRRRLTHTRHASKCHIRFIFLRVFRRTGGQDAERAVELLSAQDSCRAWACCIFCVRYAKRCPIFLHVKTQLTQRTCQQNTMQPHMANTMQPS